MEEASGDGRMAPNGIGTVVVAWVLAVLAFGALLVWWPKLSGRGWRTMLGRAASQLVATLLVLVAVAATMNAENGWYADWSDIRGQVLGDAPPHGAQVTYGANPLQARRQPAAIAADHRAAETYATQRENWVPGKRSTPPSGGTYVHTTMPGPDGHPAKLTVWLPAAYFTQPHETFPVIEAFHGVPGTPDDFHRPVHLGAIISRLVARHELAPTIVVAPGYTPDGLDTECVDAPGMPMLTWLTKDVPAWVVAHLRARPDRGSWATIGYSAGGYCAALTAMHRPQQYGSMIVLGGYFHPIFNGRNPFGRNTPPSYDLMQVERTDPSPVAAWVQVALQDPVSGRVSERFAQRARAPMSVTTVEWRRVGHRFSVWISAMPLALEWLGQARASFRPGAAAD
ncbi:alpha/beta hydrolase [Flexivirga caeni]|uniref:Esterase n=1 Tax=Flexivirga caeni TaxID=2294115 RepID=A0A3M9MDY2_9MICO|nr:alpha/beta hydrolase-fold protein [Flexivirga caeni]RNI23782.1 hypothetical protein EFY87_05735 [Flexivirga caeni]